MATLDIFANNIINSGNGASISAAGNVGRWTTINSSNFFIVNTLSVPDSLSISNIIDGTTTGSIIIFDRNGNIGVYIKSTGLLTNTILNPLVDNTNVNFSANSRTAINQKTFTDPTLPGYCTDNNNIFSLPGLKWILHRDSTKTMYLLYNPMHSLNVKNYYNSQTGTSGDMSNLIQKYVDAFTVTAASDTNKTAAVYSDPTCSCFSNIKDCVNDYVGFYMDNQLDSNSIGYNCLCGTKSACSDAYINDENNDQSSDSFLSSFKDSTKASAGITNCNAKVTICDMFINSGGNTTFKDSQLTQKCGTSSNTQSGNTPSSTQSGNTPSSTQPGNQPPSNTQVQAQAQPKLSTPIIVGSALGGLLIIILIIIIYMKK